MSHAKTSKGAAYYARMFVCVLMSVVLAMGLTPIVPQAAPQAYAANADKPTSVYMQYAGALDRIDVMKNVATLDANMGKGITIMFDVKDNYNNLSSNDRRRYLIYEDSQGVESQLSETSTNRVGFMSEQIVEGQ